MILSDSAIFTEDKPMQVFWIIFLQELRLFGHNLSKIFASFLFFIISLTVFLLLAQNQQNQGSNLFYSITIIWFSLLFSLIFSAGEFLKKDFEDGTIEQIITSIDNFEIFILAKMLANWLVYALPILLAILPICALIGVQNSNAQSLLLSALLATLAINFICNFCGSISILGNSAPMIAILALPLVIPILLIGAGNIGEENTNIKLLSGLVVFIGSISVLATAKIVKIAVE